MTDVQAVRRGAGQRQAREADSDAFSELLESDAQGPARRQLAVTIVADVKRGRLSELKRTLELMGADPANNAIVPFAALPRAHFARLLVLDADDESGAPIEPHLIYLADVDAPPQAGSPLDRCLGELVDVAGAGLDRLFGACDGYPAPSRATRARRLAFLRDHTVPAAAAYVNTLWRSARQIREEDRLRVEIGRFIDAHAAELQELEPAVVRARIQDFVRGQPDLAWALSAAPSPGVADRAREIAHLLALPSALLALAPALAPALPLYAFALRRQEKRDPDPHIIPTREHALSLAEIEDRAAQNQFSAVGFLKPGLLRRVTAEVVTRGIDYAARHVFNHANLGGVKTIHSARWVWLDERRRLIFASNYDGSLESYNDDFIDKVWWGLNAVFSNGVGYPRTRWLFFDGAKQEQPFKDYLRRRQVPSQVWYSAYPYLTALNVENNARIRAGLSSGMSGKETEAWLRLI